MKMALSTNGKQFNLNYQKPIFIIVIILFTFIFYTSSAQAIITLKCNDSIIMIDEENKKAGPKGYVEHNYRNISPEKIVFEIAWFRTSEKAPRIWRMIFDLEELEHRYIFLLQVSDKDMDKVMKLVEKEEAGKINYDKIDQLKKELFEKYYIKPENFDDFDGKVNTWSDSKKVSSEHPGDHILKKDGRHYQVSFSTKCTIVN